MKRTKIVLAVAALLVAMLAAIPGPAAMADVERCHVSNDNDVARCDGDTFFNTDQGDFFFGCGEEIGGIFFTIPPFNDCGFDNADNVIFQSVG